MTYQLALISCLAALGFIRPTSLCAETAAAYQANDWDQEITLPPQAYRASRPIEIDGKFDIKTQPGTLLRDIHFEGRKEAQHWIVDGTIMHHVRIGGQLGVRLNGVGSVFENCDFEKDSGWFVQWWSTRWMFENCIFTRTFIRNELSSTDFGAHATRCTFYEVKLPPIGLKKDSASYLQKEHMGFEQCRFVDCDVPETFLAATVNCLFEHCNFAHTALFKWPAETSPIKVTAYYTGPGDGPPSFLNGPLTVQFLSAPRDKAFGSSLVHSRSGEQVTLNNMHFPQDFVQLGSLTKKASEIVEESLAVASPASAVTTAPMAGTPISTPAATQAPSPPGPADVRSLEEMLASLPSNVQIMNGGEPYPAGIETANAWLTRHCTGLPAAMRLSLENTQSTTLGGYAYKANARPQALLYQGDAIASNVVAMFRSAAAGPLSRVQHNEDFNVRGTVLGAAFTAYGHALTFTMAIGEARVEDALPTPTPTPVAPLAN